MNKDKLFLIEAGDFNSSELIQELNSKAVLICHQAEHKQEEEALLEKILSAIGKRLNGDAKCLEIKDSAKLRLGPILRDSAVELVIAFDCRPEQFAMNSSPLKYTPLTIANRTFIFSDALSELEKNKNLKIMLWNALKASQSN